MNEIEKAKFKLSILRHAINCENFAEYKMLFDDKGLSDELELAIQALQEKLERENGCEYCKGGGNAKSLIDGETTVFITSEDKVFCADCGGDGYLEFSYCPMCGRKLNHVVPKHIGEATNMKEE